MHVTQKTVPKTGSLSEDIEIIALSKPDLLLMFASPEFFAVRKLPDFLREALPNTALIGCSTAGGISAAGLVENACILTGIQFDATHLLQASTRLADMADSFPAGVRLGQQLAHPDLRAILLYSPGVEINGSALVDGVSRVVGPQVLITGGLAGDNDAFKRTFTLGLEGVWDDRVVAVGLAGTGLLLSHGSAGGWMPFGPARKVTRCEHNTLFELDGEPALDVYKRYLGEHARRLPASGLLFPFAMQGQDQTESGLIRTILGVDEAAGSLTLAGDIDPQGYLRLMHASTERLVKGAEAAADAALAMFPPVDERLAILVSCVGRRLVMGSRVNEEITAVVDLLGPETRVTGFYSYGEISPSHPGSACQLHNQTMTITCLAEG